MYDSCRGEELVAAIDRVMAKVPENCWFTTEIQRRCSGYSSYEHGFLAEEILGRPLEWWEEVHHINGQRSDNRPHNLCVISKLNHRMYHGLYNWIIKNYAFRPHRDRQIDKLRHDFDG